jgi:hypothetical protein
MSSPPIEAIGIVNATSPVYKPSLLKSTVPISALFFSFAVEFFVSADAQNQKAQILNEAASQLAQRDEIMIISRKCCF